MSKPTAPGVIDPECIYTVPELAGRSKLGDGGMRDARTRKDNPLKVVYLHGHPFVSGADFLAYLKAHAKESHHTQK